MHPGMLYATAANVLWGLFPLYFKALQSISPTEILAHRVLWSLGFLLLVLAGRRQWAWLGSALRERKVLAGFAASAALLTAHWLLYIWAVSHGRILEASLGYFITPLFGIAIGFLLLHERLRTGQWLAVILAGCGLAWLSWQGGHLPWTALLLAITWTLYSLLRKTASLGPLDGLALETLLLSPIALGYLLLAGGHGYAEAPASAQWLLAASGPITAIPLLLFAAGARRISLSLLGLLQYIAPTIQMMLGIWLYHEPFGNTRLIGFMLSWSALAVYTIEGLWSSRRLRSGCA